MSRESGVVRACLNAFWDRQFNEETLDSEWRMAAALVVAADWLAERAPAVELHPTFHRAFKEAARCLAAAAQEATASAAPQLSQLEAGAAGDDLPAAAAAPSGDNDVAPPEPLPLRL
ncbi:MAG: hypothetical protein LW834_01675, partial [Cyanobium sp. 49614_E6]|nr:hypothetical protein [Cyanobium sp. 49614_E6]